MMLRREPEADHLLQQVKRTGSRDANEVTRAAFEVAVRDRFGSVADRRAVDEFVRSMHRAADGRFSVEDAVSLFREALGEVVSADDIGLVPEMVIRGAVLARLADEHDAAWVLSVLAEAERLALARGFQPTPVSAAPATSSAVADHGPATKPHVTDFVTLRLMPAHQREQWLRATYSGGRPAAWWTALAKAAEDEVRVLIISGRAASGPVFELASWILDTGRRAGTIGDIDAAYRTLRLAYLATQAERPVENLPASMTPEAAVRGMLDAMKTSGASLSISLGEDGAQRTRRLLVALSELTADSALTASVSRSLAGINDDGPHPR